MTLTFGSLFSGVGGFDLGFSRAGLVCRWQVEVSEFCRRVLARHWPDVPRHEDVRDFPPAQSVAADFAVDVICGGDPCQENSRARVSAGTVAPSLGGEFVRIVGQLKPRFVVRENPRHVRTDAPWPWWKFCDELRKLDYVVQPVPVRACCFGYAHRRERMLVLAQRADAYRQPIWVPGRAATPGTQAAMQGEASQRQRVRADPGAVVCGTRRGVDAGVGRGVDGVPGGVDRPGSRGGTRAGDRDRLKALGNALVPDIAEWVGRLLVAAS